MLRLVEKMVDLERFKRPIRPYYRTATAPLRALPDTLIIGAQKAGTTSLHNYLCQHPAIFPSSTKEAHFFDCHYEKGPLWYRRHFPFFWEHEGRIVEATTGYMFFEKVLPRIREVLAEVKLIAVLRDPVDRAFSHYQHARRGMGRHCATEHRSFEEAAEDDRARLEDGHLLGRMNDQETYFCDRYYSYLRRGIYAPQLERYFSVYGDEVMVVRSRDLFNRTQDTVDKIFAHLGVSTWEVESTEKHNEGGYGEVNPLRDELRGFYRAYNRELYDLLGVNAWWE